LVLAGVVRSSDGKRFLESSVVGERGTPMWMSPLEVMKLSIGEANFTCCQRNHVITILENGRID